ncbi:MAG: TIGR03618 family F420-dependent PPOX class oxidoreductase [Anaerolineales bacterium]|nr:TIGR03618 family F420-dependent PPOX class oxidoreductase [Anaerolineales bacterium]
MNIIPESHRDLITDEKKALASLATLMDDGSPQVTPVWFDVEGDFLRINTVRGRVKDRNMVSRREVAMLIMDPGDPYRYIHIRGTVAAQREEDAVEHTHVLAKKYLGVDKNPWHEGKSRVIFLIQPDTVSTMG